MTARRNITMKTLLFVAFLLVFPSALFAQGEEEFKQWKNEEDAKLKQFKDKTDQAFY